MEEIRDCIGHLACCGDASTGFVTSLYKGHRTSAYLAVGESFTVEGRNTRTIVTRATDKAFHIVSYHIAA